MPKLTNESNKDICYDKSILLLNFAKFVEKKMCDTQYFIKITTSDFTSVCPSVR